MTGRPDQLNTCSLVVGPFYLSRALGLETVLVGLVLSVGPLVAPLTGVPAGRMVDRYGAQRMIIVGLIDRNGGRVFYSIHDAGKIRHRRLHLPHRRYYRQLCVVPGG